MGSWVLRVRGYYERVSVNSGSWWWTGRPGVLRFMGSQRVRHDWATELNWGPILSSLQTKYRHTNTHIMTLLTIQFSSFQSLRCVWLFVIPWTAARHASLSITNSQSPPNSCLLSWWCHPTISSLGIPFFSHLQSFPESGSFQISQLFASGGQSVGVSASTSVLPKNTQDWSPLDGLVGSPCCPKDSRIFSNTTVQKHQFFNAQ